MYLISLGLTNFRNYDQKLFGFGGMTTVLVGPNAAGKTNVLEAIYLLAVGNSLRAGRVEEMVLWGEEVGHVTGKVVTSPEISNSNDQNSDELRVTLTRGMVQGKRAAKRRYLVNGVGKRKMDFVGRLQAVLFTPEDLRLVTGSPRRRRGYFDAVLSLVDRDYRRSMVSYEKALRRRNRLLDLIRDGRTQRSALVFWDKLLIKEGDVISSKRRAYVNFVNGSQEVAGERRMIYEPSVISEKRLEQYKQAEVAAGHTLVGPHKDDFRIISKVKEQMSNEDRDLAIYGSRGEQRMAVLWLKLAELAFVEQSLSLRPVLLLDDIFSELDDEHDKMVMNLLGNQQTIIATTEVDGRFKEVKNVEIVNI